MFIPNEQLKKMNKLSTQLYTNTYNLLKSISLYVNAYYNYKRKPLILTKTIKKWLFFTFQI